MIRNFVCAAPQVVFPVELVEPVELRGIRRGHVGPARGTGGTGAAGHARAAGVKIFLRGSPPVPPTGSTKINKTACSTTGSTWPPRSATVLSPG